MTDLSQPENILTQLWVIPGKTLKSCGRFAAFEDVQNYLVRYPVAEEPRLIFVSHRWEDRDQPDPGHSQFGILAVSGIDDDAFYWYDYTCLPQLASPAARSYLNFVLKNLNHIVTSSELLVLRQETIGYFSRGWCFHEWFTAQFVGSKGRTFLNESGRPDHNDFNVVSTKRKADRILGGHFELLDELGFSEDRDRNIVKELTKNAAITAQRKICQTCLEILHKTMEGASHHFPSGLAISIDNIHAYFIRLVRFLKVWTLQLQLVEPVTDRIAMFFHARHWESLIELSRHIDTDLLAIEYSRQLRDEEVTPVERELRRVYEFCQMKMPEARYAVRH